MAAPLFRQRWANAEEFVCTQENVSASDLSSALGIDHDTANSFLEVFENRGIVCRLGIGGKRPVLKSTAPTGSIILNEIAVLDEKLRNQKETIADLRAKGKRAVADRDCWEALANELREQVGLLRAKVEAAVGDRQNILNNLNVKDRELTACDKEISELRESLLELRKQLDTLAAKERKKPQLRRTQSLLR